MTKTIKIHFSKNKEGKILSKAIMWYENATYSHCAIEFYLNSINKEVMYHSSLVGVNFSSKDLFLKHNEIVETYGLEVPIEIYRKIMSSLIDNCGKEYAIMQNFGIVIVEVLAKLGKNINNPWKDGYNCSELVYEHVIKNIYEEDFKINRNLIKPSQVKQILDNKKEN